MKFILYILVIFLISCTNNAEKHDKAYLAELIAAYEEAEMNNDMQKNQNALDACIAEAGRQKNLEEENFARRQKLACYCNYAEYEKLYLEVPIQAEFFRQHKLWNSYYYALQKEIEVLPIQNRYESALRKAQNLYAEAQKEQHKEGNGVACYCIGYIYHFTGRDEEAEIYLQKALGPLKESKNNSTLVNCYDKLSETLTSLKKYETSISVTRQYEQLILALEKDAHEKELIVDYYGLWHMCYYNYAYAYYGLKNADKVEYYYKTMCENQGESAGFVSITQIVKRMLARLKGDFPYFMASTDTLIQEYKNLGNPFFVTELLNEKAEVSIDIQQFENAAYIYKEIISIKDSLYKTNTATQLDDLRSIYELDHLTAEKEKNHLYAIIAFSVCLFLIILLILYALYSRRLKEKNRYLFNRIQYLAHIEKEQQRIEYEEVVRFEEQQKENAPIPDMPADFSREELLVKRLRVWLNDNNRFIQPDLNRRQMADYLGTNEKYIADAIRNQCNGQTVNDFINNLRLSYARDLLIGQPSMTIEAIAIETGLNSRITLFRLFRKHYGMSPSEFRSIQKQN